MEEREMGSVVGYGGRHGLPAPKAFGARVGVLRLSDAG